MPTRLRTPESVGNNVTRIAAWVLMHNQQEYFGSYRCACMFLLTRTLWSPILQFCLSMPEFAVAVIGLLRSCVLVL